MTDKEKLKLAICGLKLILVRETIPEIAQSKNPEVVTDMLEFVQDIAQATLINIGERK